MAELRPPSAHRHIGTSARRQLIGFRYAPHADGGPAHERQSQYLAGTPSNRRMQGRRVCAHCVLLSNPQVGLSHRARLSRRHRHRHRPQLGPDSPQAHALRSPRPERPQKGRASSLRSPPRHAGPSALAPAHAADHRPPARVRRGPPRNDGRGTQERGTPAAPPSTRWNLAIATLSQRSAPRASPAPGRVRATKRAEPCGSALSLSLVAGEGFEPPTFGL